MVAPSAFFAFALNCARQNNRDLSSPSSSGVFILVKGLTFIDADTGTVKNLKKWIVGKQEAWRRAVSGKQVSMILGINFLRLLEPNSNWMQRITLLTKALIMIALFVSCEEDTAQGSVTSSLRTLSRLNKAL